MAKKQKRVTCNKCHGAGELYHPALPPVPCRKCNGTGFVDRADQRPYYDKAQNLKRRAFLFMQHLKVKNG